MSLLMSILRIVSFIPHILHVALKFYSSRNKMVPSSFVSISGASTKSRRKTITYSPASLTSLIVLVGIDSSSKWISSTHTTLSGFKKVMSEKPPSIPVTAPMNGVLYLLDSIIPLTHSNILWTTSSLTYWIYGYFFTLITSWSTPITPSITRSMSMKSCSASRIISYTLAPTNAPSIRTQSSSLVTS